MCINEFVMFLYINVFVIGHNGLYRAPLNQKKVTIMKLEAIE